MEAHDHELLGMIERHPCGTTVRALFAPKFPPTWAGDAAERLWGDGLIERAGTDPATKAVRYRLTPLGERVRAGQESIGGKITTERDRENRGPRVFGYGTSGRRANRTHGRI